MARRLTSAAAAVALALATLPATATAATSWTKVVRSSPGLRIPRVWTTVNDPGKAPGYIFVTPRAKLGQRTGPTILDSDGRVVWFHRLSRTRTAIGLQPQTYLGKPVLTWGQRPPLVHEGDLYTGNRHTVYNVIADQSYRIVARVRARGRGVNTDLHEFQITSRNTALVLGFRILPRNLRRYGGPRHGAILDNVVQEIDIASGRVLFSWSAARRLSPRDSYIRPPSSGAWDAYHVNSVTEDSDGNLLATARHTSAVYKLDRRTGRVIWRLGGKRSSFKLSAGARFYYAHDAQRAPDGTLTLFDNHGTGLDKRGRTSRGLRLLLDTARKTATVAGVFRHPSGNVLATSQGDTRVLDGGNVFVGWGSSPWFSEYTPDGRLLFAGHFQTAWNQSYRAFKAPWTGSPAGKPAVVASTRTGRLIAFVSWNGATQVAAWRVLGGEGADSLQPLGDIARSDYETKLDLPAKPAMIQVQALDGAGNVLGASDPVKPKI
jgi:outer membrane protein assembly factor BamB